MNSNNSTRRTILAALGTGATVGLAGCNSPSEPDNSQTENSEDEDQAAENETTESDPFNVELRSVEDADLSDVEPAREDPGNHDLHFSVDTTEADEDIILNFSNGVQESSFEASTRDLKEDDGDAILEVPNDLLPHGDIELTAQIGDEKYQADFNVETPEVFKIDRSVEGEQASNFQTEWSFAQHDLDRGEARKTHLDYVNDEFVRGPIVDESLYNGTHGLGSEYDERIAQIEQMDPSTDMLDILEIAGDIASDMEHDVPNTPTTGTTQSGEEIGHGAAQIIRDIHDTDLKTIVASDPRNSLDSIIHYNSESDELIFQGTNGTTTSMERGLSALEKESDTPRTKSMIYGFEPGYVDGIDDTDASKKNASAKASIMSMVRQNTWKTTYIMNDYFLAEASDQIFEEDNIEAVIDIASTVEEMALATYQEDRNPEEDMSKLERLKSGKIVVYIDEDESLDDTTLAYVQDDDIGFDIYREVKETEEPLGRDQIEQTIGLN